MMVSFVQGLPGFNPCPFYMFDTIMKLSYCINSFFNECFCSVFLPFIILPDNKPKFPPSHTSTDTNHLIFKNHSNILAT